MNLVPIPDGPSLIMRRFATAPAEPEGFQRRIGRAAPHSAADHAVCAICGRNPRYLHRYVTNGKHPVLTEARKHSYGFLLWQSDVDQAVTTRAIRAASRAAMTAVEKDYPVDVKLEEATRNPPGSSLSPASSACVCAYDPAAGAYHARTEGAHEHDVAPAVRRQHCHVVAHSPQVNEERPHAQSAACCRGS